MIVADTNLIAYLYLPAPQTEIAERVLQRDHDWAAPALWRSEYRNVLALHLRQEDLALDDAIAAMHAAETLMAGGEYLVQSTQVLGAIAGTAVSAYDGEFVALARQLQVPLLTFDRRLRNAFPEVAKAPETILR